MPRDVKTANALMFRRNETLRLCGFVAIQLLPQAKAFLFRPPLPPAPYNFTTSKLSKVFQASTLTKDADVIAKTGDLMCMRKPILVIIWPSSYFS